MSNNRAVIVVHGVGDQHPGTSVEDLATHYSKSIGASVRPERSLITLDESTTNFQGNKHQFPLHIVRADNDYDTLLFAEVFWADLSRVSSGPLGVLRGIFDIVFGLPHLVRHATEVEGLPNEKIRLSVIWLRRISAAITILLRGPVIGLNLILAFAAISVAVVAFLNPAWLDSAVDFKVFVFGVVSFVIVWALIHMFRNRNWAAISLFWTLTLSAALCVIALFRITQGSSVTSIWWYGELLIGAVNWTWWLIATLALPLVIIWWQARNRVPVERLPSIDIAFICTILSAILWSLALSTLWLATIKTADIFQKTAELQTNTDDLLKSALNLFGVTWIWAISLAMIFFIVWGARQFAKSQNTSTNFEPVKWAIRLIIPNFLWCYFAFTVIVWFILEQFLLFEDCASADGLFCLKTGHVNHDPLALKLQEWVRTSNRIAAITTVALAGTIAVFIRKPIRSGLDIGLDIVNYFRSTVRSQANIHTFAEAQIRHTIANLRFKVLDEKYSAQYERRMRMLDRFSIVIDWIAEHENIEHISVVAHSQGSMIAIEALQSPAVQSALPDHENNHLITMGCPYDHLYRHYFPQQHPSLTTLSLPKIGRWLNIFRGNDFVGTDLDGANNRPVNISIAPRGHTGYWHDRDVLDHIKQNAPL